MKKISIPILLGASVFASSVVQAGVPVTRQTHDFLSIVDDSGVVSAQVSRMGTSGSGIQGVGSGAISNSQFRGGKPESRLDSCNDLSTSIVWHSESKAMDAIARCFTNSVYNEMAEDLSHLLDNTTARSGYYSYTHNLRIRASNGEVEDRFLHAGVFLRANQSHGQAQILGLTISPSANVRNIYAIYEHAESFPPIGGDFAMQGAGELRIYAMEGITPTGNMRLIHSERSSDFEVDMRSLEDDPAGDSSLYDRSGALAAIHFLDTYMEHYDAEMAILDYGNPASPALVLDEQASDPECSIPGADLSDAECLLGYGMTIETPERWYVQNQCTGGPVEYGQLNEIVTPIMYQRDRYVINGDANFVRILGLSNNEIVPTTNSVKGQIRTFNDIYDIGDLGEIRVESLNVHNYAYETPISLFNNNMTEPYGVRSAPDNLFRIGSDDPFNNIEASVFENTANVIDDSMVDVDYVFYKLVSDGYYNTEQRREQTGTSTSCTTRTDSDGEIVYDSDGEPVKDCTTTPIMEWVSYSGTWTPDISSHGTYGDRRYSASHWVAPEYKKVNVNVCLHHTQEDRFCDTYNCDDSAPAKENRGYIVDENVEKYQQESFYWSTGSWLGCQENCNIGTERRSVVCMSTTTGNAVSDTNCSNNPKPISERPCEGTPSACSFEWFTGDWSECSAACEGGTKTRDVYCRAPDGSRVSDNRCSGGKPSEQSECNTGACSYRYNVGSWSSCTSNAQCMSSRTSNSCSFYGKEYRCTPVTRVDSSNARSTGWRNQRYTTLTGARDDGFNGSHFICSSSSTSGCGYGYYGTVTTTVVYGQRSRTVECIRTNDGQRVSMGNCVDTQDFTHERCVISSSSTGRCRRESPSGI